MKILSMTATFGKLQHQTLTLHDGLNVIEAPNEWGKSTWCAFLVSMLYGIDTRERSTAATLAAKERYAPWSGAPMSGSIDLVWQDKRITIERSSRGRIPFGEFRAYETETGIEIPELTGANCGQTLLGVERSVFVRAGFLKLADLPVTQDDSLRRRLNNLVTTGDESGAGDQLSQQLRDLKNKCRFNRSGLLPQAENERDQLKAQLDDLHALTQQSEQLQAVQKQLEDHIAALENHKSALRYNASLQDLQRVEEAEQAAAQAEAQLQAITAQAQELPDAAQAQKDLLTAQMLQEEWLALQMESQMLPPPPQAPEVPAHWAGIDPEQAPAIAEADLAQNDRLERARRRGNVFLILFEIVLGLALSGIAFLYFYPIVDISAWFLPAAGGIVAAELVLILISAIRTGRLRKKLTALYDRHPSIAPGSWVEDAQQYADSWYSYRVLLGNSEALRADTDARIAQLQARIDALTDGQPMAQCQRIWAETVAVWESVGDARRSAQQARAHAQTLKAMAKTAEPPKSADSLTYTEAETDSLLTEARLKLRQLHLMQGQCQGQMESLGSPALMRARLDTLNRRIARLEDTYYALEMAQNALRDATMQLQRRFAPQISRRAQVLFSKLTDGRYQKLTLGQDLNLSTCAENEDTLRPSVWRSDGTGDQLYLALRLAVAEALTPDAPLVLDDAFVRFDDTRLEKAMQILRETAERKQVILFTCQHREKEYL